MEDGQAAHAGVEDADGPRVHGVHRKCALAWARGSGAESPFRSSPLRSCVPARRVRTPGLGRRRLELPVHDCGLRRKPLACVDGIPNGTAPAGGWPGVILFHGLGQSYADMEPIGGAMTRVRARRARLRRPRHRRLRRQVRARRAAEVQDAQTLFDWFSGRSDISDTEIGAFGLSLGGGAVWNAAVAGVPFKAIVPAITWTSLGAALNPNGVPKTGLIGDPLPGRAPRELGPGARADPAGPAPGQCHAGGQEHGGGPLAAAAPPCARRCRPSCCRDATTSSSTWIRRPRRGSSSPGRSASTSATWATLRPRTRAANSRTTSATPPSGSTTTSSKPTPAARPPAKSCSPTIPGTPSRPSTRSCRRPRRRASTSLGKTKLRRAARSSRLARCA